jgi:nitrilase
LLLGGQKIVRVAIIQSSPAYLDKEKTIEKSKQKISEAAAQGANIIVFPEAWLSAYPYWIPTALGEEDNSKYGKAISMMQDSSIQIPSEDTAKLCDAARKHRVNLVLGCNELSSIPGSRTIYNSLLFIGSDGALLGRHRKLMPTHEERLVWGMGDGRDLRIYETNAGRIGGLICWENHMILARAAMIMKGEEFHVAVWPGSWNGTSKKLNDPDPEGKFCDVFPAIREHAFESGAFVISACPYITRDQIPVEFPYRDKMNIGWACGGSAVVDPFGNYLSEPLFGRESIIYSNCDADSIKVAKAFFDSLGHYARFDVARLDLIEEEEDKAKSSHISHPEKISESELKRLAEKYDIDRQKIEELYETLVERKSRPP